MRVLREEMRWEERFIRWSARFAIDRVGVVHGEGGVWCDVVGDGS